VRATRLDAYHRRMRGIVVACAVVALSSAGCGTSGSSDGAPPSDGGGTGRDAPGASSCAPNAGFTDIVTCAEAMDGGAFGRNMCVLTMPISGGISAMLCEGSGATICGTGSPPLPDGAVLYQMDWNVRSTGTTIDTDVTVYLDATFALDQPQTLPAAVDIRQNIDGGSLEWKTPDGACTITIAGSVCRPNLGDRILSGSGTCTAAAAPIRGNTAAPITIGDFTFNGYIHP
jgi:hypothetical protein